MKMEQVNGKYEKVLEILKRAKPQLGSTGQIEENVLNRISANQKKEMDLSGLIDFIFGWTYIKWVRRSLIAVSVCLVIMFLIQQTIMMKQINNLSNKTESYERDASGLPGNYPDRKMQLIRYQEKRFPFFHKSNPEKQVEELFRTIDQLKTEYKELDNLLKENPVLRKQIEKKLSEINGTKIKL